MITETAQCYHKRYFELHRKREEERQKRYWELHYSYVTTPEMVDAAEALMPLYARAVKIRWGCLEQAAEARMALQCKCPITTFPDYSCPDEMDEGLVRLRGSDNIDNRRGRKKYHWTDVWYQDIATNVERLGYREGRYDPITAF